jgi:capsular polysaccharide transport system permease protein
MTPIFVQIRVILALVLREARVRHGRSRAGYTWSIVEPVLLISVLTFLFTNFRSQSDSAINFAIFFATGVLPFQLFRNSSQYISQAFQSNLPLFNYPMVKPIDAVIGRTVLEFATHIVVMVLVLSFQILFLDADLPNDIATMLLAVFLLIFLAFGAGLNLAITRRRIPSISNLYTLIMGPAFFISGVFFSLSSLPSVYRELLAWNPLIHGLELFRSGYFVGYETQDISVLYLFWWGITLTFIGLLRERIGKRVDV